jgi:radical SAM superfamily enzyme
MELLQGTLDLLILHALARAKMHGYAIAQCIHLLSDEALRVLEDLRRRVDVWLELGLEAANDEIEGIALPT